MGQVKQVLLQRGSLPACFEIRADTVVELLKLPADGDMERAAKESMFQSVRMSGPFLSSRNVYHIYMGADPKCKSKNYERACVFEHPRL